MQAGWAADNTGQFQIPYGLQYSIFVAFNKGAFGIVTAFPIHFSVF